LDHLISHEGDLLAAVYGPESASYVSVGATVWIFGKFRKSFRAILGLSFIRLGCTKGSVSRLQRLASGMSFFPD